MATAASVDVGSGLDRLGEASPATGGEWLWRNEDRTPPETAMSCKTMGERTPRSMVLVRAADDDDLNEAACKPLAGLAELCGRVGELTSVLGEGEEDGETETFRACDIARLGSLDASEYFRVDPR